MRCLHVRSCRVSRTPLMHYARRSLSRHLHACLLGQSLGIYRHGRAEKFSPVKLSLTVQAVTGRKYSQSSRAEPQVAKLLKGIDYEREHRFTNTKGVVDFHSFLNEELQAVKSTVLEQQGKVLVPFQLDAIKYVDWEPDQREAYLQRLHHALWTLRRAPNGGGIGHHRSAPTSMHRRSSVPNRPAAAAFDQLFNINKGHQQPQHSPPASQPSEPPSSAATARLSAPVFTGAQDIVRPASPSQSSSTGASASGHNESSAHSASLSHAGSSSGSRAEPARAAPGPVELSDAVQEFLAKPVSGPYRPIFFDLETTGGLSAAHRILELGAIGDHTNREFTSLVNTQGIRSTEGAWKTHGITDAESWHPSTPVFGVVLSQFLEFVQQECGGPEGGIPVLIAHNGKGFDSRFLIQECKRWQVPIPSDWQWLDSLLLAKECVPDPASRALGSLRERFGIAANQAHRALDDCLIMRQVVNSHLLRLNNTATIADVMGQNSKCSGSFGDLQKPASKKRSSNAKQKSTEHTNANLIQDEEEAVFSEPDPVSTVGLASSLTSQTSLEQLKEVKVRWQHGVIDNTKLDRELLDLPPNKVKAMTITQQKNLTSAGFETFWEVLQYYPKDYIVYQPYLQSDAFVQLQGTVAKSSAGGPYLQLQIQVDPTHNPLLHPPEPLGILSLTEMTNPELELAPQAHNDSASHSDDLSNDDITEDDEEAMLDELHLDDSAELSMIQELNEHGRTVLPEETSTSARLPPDPASSSLSGARLGNSGNPEQQCGQQTLEIRQFFAGRFGRYGASKVAMAHPAGCRVQVHCKVSPGAAPGRWTTSEALLLPATPGPPPLQPLLVARYPARKAIKDKEWPKYMDRALRAVASNEQLKKYDVLPSPLRDQYDVIGWLHALISIHKPTDAAALEAAKQRLAFEELLLLQLKLLLRREIDRSPRGTADLEGTCIDQLDMMQAGRAALGFRLTHAQDRVLDEIVRDMQGPAPMLRLLQGDVGSGKTAVAMLALLAAAGSGWQGALMAPTEVLAEQHIMKLEQLLQGMPPELRPACAILTGSAKAKERKAIYAGLADGSISIIVGTHALITDALEFKKLGVAVIDEQHRFGVGQRAKLQNKNSPLPHLLAMTATPIPRTLALTAHGDMALSAIDELPPGRQPVQTFAYQDNPTNRSKMYETIRKELAEGGRTYIICPLVEESSSEIMTDVKAAEEEHRRLQQDGVLGDVGCGLLHGRMSSEDKFAALQAFAIGETPVLISTTVVEVGVDVPEASVIIVEHSERFGLAQLHQLRGRVGRGSRASTCYLMTPHRAALGRLQVLTQSQNGFTIAEADLQDRGPGDFLGKKQSGKDGLSYLKAAKLPEDRQLLEQARAAAAGMLQEMGLDPSKWPADLLAALKDPSLPDLDLAELPQLTWGSQKAVEAGKEAAA